MVRFVDSIVKPSLATLGDAGKMASGLTIWLGFYLPRLGVSGGLLRNRHRHLSH